MKCNFSQFLFATMSPPVLLVSAPRTTPSFQITAQMVVPVLDTFGGLKPCPASMVFLLQFSKLNPAGGASIGIRVAIFEVCNYSCRSESSNKSLVVLDRWLEALP